MISLDGLIITGPALLQLYLSESLSLERAVSKMPYLDMVGLAVRPAAQIPKQRVIPVSAQQKYIHRNPSNFIPIQSPAIFLPPHFTITHILLHILTLIIAGRMLSTLRLTTLTVIGREQQKKLNQIITYLMELPDCAEFINPVDWEQLELNDYPLIVKHPMHLLKVQDKLKAREYRTVEEVLDHIELIWDNCKLYNPEGHYFVMADKMERSFKKMIRNYLPNIQVVVPKPVGSVSSVPEKYQPPQPAPKPPTKLPARVSHPPQTYNPPKEITQDPHDFADKPESAEVDEIPQAEKNRFHQRLKQLTQQQLGNIIYMIQQNCSEGYKELGGGRGQIHLDSIDSETFRKLNGKLDDMLDGEKMIGSKKIKS